MAKETCPVCGKSTPELVRVRQDVGVCPDCAIPGTLVGANVLGPTNELVWLISVARDMGGAPSMDALERHIKLHGLSAGGPPVRRNLEDFPTVPQ